MDLYPRGRQITPGLPVYKPEPYTGLLGKKKTASLLDNFAGGMLQGYQIRPALNPTQYGMSGGGANSRFDPSQMQTTGGHFMPIQPSGVYDPEPNGNAPIGQDASGGDGPFNAMHMIQLNNAIQAGKHGNMATPDLANYFQANDDGTFSIRENSEGLAMADWMPISDYGVTRTYDDMGMSPDDAVTYWSNQLRQIDNTA